MADRSQSNGNWIRAAKRERKALDRALRQIEAPLPPETLLQKLLEHVPPEAAAPARRPVWRNVWVGGAALAAFAAWPASCRLSASP